MPVLETGRTTGIGGEFLRTVVGSIEARASMRGLLILDLGVESRPLNLGIGIGELPSSWRLSDCPLNVAKPIRVPHAWRTKPGLGASILERWPSHS